MLPGARDAAAAAQVLQVSQGLLDGEALLEVGEVRPEEGLHHLPGGHGPGGAQLLEHGAHAALVMEGDLASPCLAPFDHRSVGGVGDSRLYLLDALHGFQVGAQVVGVVPGVGDERGDAGQHVVAGEEQLGAGVDQ